MSSADATHYEANRLRALQRYRVLDTKSDPALDELTHLAATLCGTSRAFIGLVDHHRIWFKSKVGWDIEELPREGSLCDRAIQPPHTLLLLPDFHPDPCINGFSDIRFYAGMPLVTEDNFAIGTLAVLDIEPKTLTEHQIATLRTLSHQVITHFELQASIIRLQRTAIRRKRIERALYDKNQQFRQAIYNLQQTQTQLVQNEKMSGLGQMLAGVAHEINNPVSFVYGNLTYVNRYVEDLFELLTLYQRHYPQPHPAIQDQIDTIDLHFMMSDLPKILNSMKIGADRIRQIVLSLRNFSRLDEADKKAADIHEGIDSTLMILQHRIKATRDRPAVEICKQYSDLPMVECYAGQLNQVFMNILTNAIDAFDLEEPCPTSPQITIYTEQRSPTDAQTSDCIRIYIRDNGAGIAPETLEHIFDPFFTTKPVGKGTGLGLSISYQVIVERHGGTLECRSELGKGTEFYIEIPIHDTGKHSSASKSGT